MERELLLWRTLFAGVTAALDKPDGVQRIRQLLGQFAPQLAGGAGDQLFFEYARLKQGQPVAIHDLARNPLDDGIMVISYRRSADGWLFTPNERQAGRWRRPGDWTHWGHMVLVPSHGPDGAAVLFDACQGQIDSARLAFADEDLVLPAAGKNELALLLAQIDFQLQQLKSFFVAADPQKFLQPAEAEKFLHRPAGEKFLQPADSKKFLHGQTGEKFLQNGDGEKFFTDTPATVSENLFAGERARFASRFSRVFGMALDDGAPQPGRSVYQALDELLALFNVAGRAAD